MRLKLIACKALFRELSYLSALSENVIDTTWIRQGCHDHPEQLREVLQREIDLTESGEDLHTNKILEAGITPNKLFSEGPDSPYANIVVVRAEDAENPYILALVDALKSNETKAFIREKYGDAVVPVE